MTTTLYVTDNSTIADDITSTGSYSLNKVGPGTLTITGTNSSTGATTITTGTVSVTSGGNLSSGAINMAGGTTLEYAGTGSTTFTQGRQRHVRHRNPEQHFR